jgi:ABC-2 type transport system ATP-binding protein
VHELIRTDALTVRYGSARGIEDVTLHVGAGEVLGLLGPNGAGKTTWLRAVLDLVHPTAGSAEICGLSSLDPRARASVAYLPGDLKLPQRLTGRQVIRRFTSARTSIPDQRLDELAEEFGVPLDRRIASLSKGNRQKIGLILALAPSTPVLLLDEPTSGLDPLVQQVFVDIIRKRAESGTSVVLSSHVLSELEHLADRVAVLRQGECVAVESITSLRSRTRNEWIVRLQDEASAHRVSSRLAQHSSVSSQLFGPELHVVLRGSVNPLIQALVDEDIVRLQERSGELEDLLREFYLDPREPA